MAKLEPDTLNTIFNLLMRLSELVEDASYLEYLIFEHYGETEETLTSLDELRELFLEASSRYSQLSTLRLRIAEIQPTISKDMLALLQKTIEQNSLRIPAIKRSIEEIKIEGGLL